MGGGLGTGYCSSTDPPPCWHCGRRVVVVTFWGVSLPCSTVCEMSAPQEVKFCGESFQEKNA